MVYVIEEFNGEKSIFKIGVTIKQGPRMRLQQLQRYSDHKLKLVAGLIGDEGDERMYHWAFSKHRLHGEWFADCPGIRRFIHDFPIENWFDAINELKSKRKDIFDVYKDLTLLKFEPPEIVEIALRALPGKFPIC